MIAGRRGLARKLLEAGHAHRVFGVDDVDEMVRHGRLFLGGGFGGADIHAAVHLVGVRVHDFGPLPRFGQTPGDGDANPVLPDAVGPTMETTRCVIYAPSVPHGIGLAGGHVGVGKQIMGGRRV